MSKRTTMRKQVEQYLVHRRNLGFELHKEEWLLRTFTAFAESVSHRGPLTVDLIMKWVGRAAGSSMSYRKRRLTVVRGFARYLALTEPDTQVPPSDALGRGHRHQPHIYSESEIACLIALSKQMQPAGGLRPQTYATLIGLLACTGLRISEALGLTRVDFNAEQDLLTIRESKFHKSRLVPLHPSATEALLMYSRHRDRLVPSTQSERFFITDRGTAMRYGTVHWAFHKLCIALQTERKDQQRRRIHDLRHTFACRRLQTWYQAGIDVAHAITALSVYLGHANVGNTYWYLAATPELLESAAVRFEPITTFKGQET